MFVCPAAVLVAAKLSAETVPLKTPEIDQTLVNLQTTMPLGRHRRSFRLTHRFARDPRQGDLGGLESDLFSLDNGAIIALEYRYAVASRLQAGQIARGGAGREVLVGFNISRKF